MRTPPTVSDEEIGSFMDFDALLQKKQGVAQRVQNLRRLKIAGGIATLIIIPALLVFLAVDDRGPVSDRPEKNSSEGPSTMTGPDTVASHVQQDSTLKKDPISSPKTSRPAQPAAPAISDGERVQAEDPKPAQPVTPVYHQAEPVEGYAALYDYFTRNLVYPRAAVRDSVEGIVDVVFVIDTTGKPANIVIENSLGPLFDQEVRRLVEEMPLWKPATYNGRAVQSKISLPITFGLKKASTP